MFNQNQKIMRLFNKLDALPNEIYEIYVATPKEEWLKSSHRLKVSTFTFFKILKITFTLNQDSYFMLAKVRVQ